MYNMNLYGLALSIYVQLTQLNFHRCFMQIGAFQVYLTYVNISLLAREEIVITLLVHTRSYYLSPQKHELGLKKSHYFQQH
jgi:hypothetical protein